MRNGSSIDPPSLPTTPSVSMWFCELSLWQKDWLDALIRLDDGKTLRVLVAAGTKDEQGAESIAQQIEFYAGYYVAR